MQKQDYQPQGRQTQHDRGRHPADSEVPCTICTLKFPDRATLKDHLRQMHRRRLFECTAPAHSAGKSEQCQYITHLCRSLRAHVFRVHPGYTVNQRDETIPVGRAPLHLQEVPLSSYTLRPVISVCDVRLPFPQYALASMRREEGVSARPGAGMAHAGPSIRRAPVQMQISADDRVSPMISAYAPLATESTVTARRMSWYETVGIPDRQPVSGNAGSGVLMYASLDGQTATVSLPVDRQPVSGNAGPGSDVLTHASLDTEIAPVSLPARSWRAVVGIDSPPSMQR
ncbi:hypothetical protein BKA93DRAFT_160829 [Sparassis latifolia]